MSTKISRKWGSLQINQPIMIALPRTCRGLAGIGQSTRLGSAGEMDVVGPKSPQWTHDNPGELNGRWLWVTRVTSDVEKTTCPRGSCSRCGAGGCGKFPERLELMQSMLNRLQLPWGAGWERETPIATRRDRRFQRLESHAMGQYGNRQACVFLDENSC